MNEYEFDPPEEMLPWFEYQKEKRKKEINRGNDHYILENGKIKSTSMMKFVKFFADFEKRRIDLTEVEEGITVSTVFLGLDHNYNFDPVMGHIPILFETMVFGGKFNEFQWRYATFGEAKRGHWEVVNAVKNGENPNYVLDFGEEGFWNWFKDMFDDEEDE